MSTPAGEACILNVDEILERRDLTAFTTVLVAILALALVTDGFDIVVLGVLAPAVSEEFGLSRIEIGWFLTLAHIGVAAWLHERCCRSPTGGSSSRLAVSYRCSC